MPDLQQVYHFPLNSKTSGKPNPSLCPTAMPLSQTPLTIQIFTKTVMVLSAACFNLLWVLLRITAWNVGLFFWLGVVLPASPLLLSCLCLSLWLQESHSYVGVKHLEKCPTQDDIVTVGYLTPRACAYNKLRPYVVLYSQKSWSNNYTNQNVGECTLKIWTITLYSSKSKADLKPLWVHVCICVWSSV